MKRTSRPSAQQPSYWQDLVRGETSDALDEVGHTDMGRAFNRQAYKLRLRGVTNAANAAGLTLNGCRIFEAGFGVGFYLEVWARSGASVTAVDLSASAVVNVQSRFPDFDIRQADLAALDTCSDWSSLVGTFDLVTAIDVIYHIVDDARAACATSNLAALVRPGGVLLFTEKLPSSGSRMAEQIHVTRRPLEWFQDVLGPDLYLERVSPVFWCMDPALPASQRMVGDYLARGMWIAMRAATKYLPNRSCVQEIAGGAGGRVGALMDMLAVGRAASTGNMRIVTMRRKLATISTE